MKAATILGALALAASLSPAPALGGVLVTEPGQGELTFVNETTGQLTVVNATLNLPVDVSATDSGLWAVVEPQGAGDGTIALFDAEGGFLGSFVAPPQPTVLFLGGNGALFCGTRADGVWIYDGEAAFEQFSTVPGEIAGITARNTRMFAVTRGAGGRLFRLTFQAGDTENWEELVEVGDARGVVPTPEGLVVAVGAGDGGALFEFVGVEPGDALDGSEVAELPGPPGGLALHEGWLYMSLQGERGQVVKAPIEEPGELQVVVETDALVNPAGLAWSDMCPGGGADADGDGWRVCEGDCNDADETIHPEAHEACDLVDSDCDGAPDVSELDSDADGFAGCQGDCDDGDPEMSPDSVEYCDPDGLDEDCDGRPQAWGWTEADGDDGVPECVPYAVPGFTFECSATGRGAATSLALLLAGLGLGLAARRRRGAVVGLAGLLALCVASAPDVAAAQDLEQAQRQLDFCWAEVEAGNFERAKGSADSALRLHGSLHEAMVCKALAYEGLGDLEMADAMLKTYFDFRGGLEPARQALALRERLDDGGKKRRPKTVGGAAADPVDPAEHPILAVGLAGGWEYGGTMHWLALPLDASIRLWKPLRLFFAFVPAISDVVRDPNGIPGEPAMRGFQPNIELGVALRRPGPVRILGAVYLRLAIFPEDWAGPGDEGDLVAPVGPGGLIGAEFALPGSPLAVRVALDGGALFASGDEFGELVLPSIRLSAGLVLSL
jgi:hypothetical protein